MGDVFEWTGGLLTCCSVETPQLPVPLKYRMGEDGEDEEDDAWVKAAQKMKGRSNRAGGAAAAAGKGAKTTVATSAEEVGCR